jgi:hypothetical protein
MPDAFVQAAAGKDFSVNSVGAVFGSNTTTGNVYACFVWWSNSTDTVTGVTDGTNVLLDSGLGIQRLNSAHSMQMFYSENITGLTTPTVTATFSGSPGIVDISVMELSGRKTSGALGQKQWNTQNFAGTGTDFITSNAVVTTTDGEAICGGTEAQFNDVPTAGTNFTLRTSLVTGLYTETLTAGDQVSAGSIAATFTPAGNDGYITGIMTFKAAAGGGGGGTTIAGVGKRMVGVAYWQG